MITQVLHCPNCHVTDIVKHGKSPDGKQRYKCREVVCDGRTFILNYAYPGQSRQFKQQIVDMKHYQMEKVYLLITDAGGGHRSTANALQEVIKKRQLPWQIYVVNFYKEIIGINPEDGYNLILKKGWTKIYWPLMVPLFKQQITFQNSVWLALLKNYWRQKKPELVVSLLPFVNRVLHESLQAASPNTKFVTLLIDPVDCSTHYWIEQQKQFLICPTEQAVEQARTVGYGERQIFRTSGLVINPRFYEPIIVDRRIERQNLGLAPDLPTGLVMFGGYGSTVMREIEKSLERSSLKLQLIFICGRNEKLARSLRRSQSRLPRFVETFTTEIPYYMHLSDFFIGKPGPGTISEAVAMNLPVITECNTSTMLQERYNAEWIINNQLGIVVRSFRSVETAVAELIQPENLATYRANAAATSNRGVFEVVDILEQILHTNL